MRSFDWLTRRFSHAISVVVLPFWSYVVLFGVGVVIGLYETAVTLIMPPSQRDPYDAWNLLPHVSWGWWVLFWAVAIQLIFFEGSYRLSKRQADKISELETANNNHAKQQAISTRLGELLTEGNRLLVRCGDEVSAPPLVDYELWSARASTYLEDTLGISYSSRFVSPAGLPLAATSIFSADHRAIWAAVMTRNARLTEFLHELEAK